MEVQFKIVALFLWLGTARLIRLLALQEKELDYINASRSLGSNPIKIIFSQMMPNLVGIIIVNGTLSLAANIGIESELSFVGFGFSEDYPSLGTLLSYAPQTQALQHRWRVWLQATLRIYVYATSVNITPCKGCETKTGFIHHKRRGCLLMRYYYKNLMDVIKK